LFGDEIDVPKESLAQSAKYKSKKGFTRFRECCDEEKPEKSKSALPELNPRNK